ncbi:hypothetical protein PT2222_80140 [Paraburkholderia tropica]
MRMRGLDRASQCMSVRLDAPQDVSQARRFPWLESAPGLKADRRSFCYFCNEGLIIAAESRHTVGHPIGFLCHFSLI